MLVARKVSFQWIRLERIAEFFRWVPGRRFRLYSLEEVFQLPHASLQHLVRGDLGKLRHRIAFMEDHSPSSQTGSAWTLGVYF